MPIKTSKSDTDEPRMAGAIGEALRVMVEAECSSMRLNNLGDPEKNDRIRLSRAAIAKDEGIKGSEW